MPAVAGTVAAMAMVLLPTSAQAANSAQYLGDTIPATMIPGFTYNVSVTMRNTGTTTWTKAEGYSLGAVGDSDPFAPGRIGLTDSDSIAPGQDRTFSFMMVAPSAGVYTTDWRMLRENVKWFGETLTRQVNVTFGPNPPGVPTIIWPTSGMVLGSNRPDIRFQGAPSDGYEVHIGSYNTPASNDGWDSGFVSLNPGAEPIMAMSGALNAQVYYYVFVRLHNPNGWSPWTACGHWFNTAGELVNDPNFVAGVAGAQRDHYACYNPDRNEYLITYFDSGKGKPSVISYHRLDATGTKIGSEMWIADDLLGAGGAKVCYNSTRKEYLISYGGYTESGGLHDELRLQRVDAATGAPIGGSNRVTNLPGAFNSNIAYSPRSDCYLLVWDSGYDSPCPLYATRLDSTAVPVGGIFHASTAAYVWAGGPSICYNSVNDEFFVTFQAYYATEPPTWWDYYAQRIRASDGAMLGSNITISLTYDYDTNGDVAYDSDLNRYLVIYDGGNPTPWLQFVSASGVLQGSRFPAAPNPYYNGGMSDITWNPVTKEFLATWAHQESASNFGRRLSQTGAYIGEPFRTNGNVIGFGNWDPMGLANPISGEFLIYWFWQYDNVYTRRYRAYPLPPPDTQRPEPITNLAASRTATSMNLSWTTSSSADFSATMIRAKAGAPPSGPEDGTLVVDKPNAPSTMDSFTHTGPPKGVRYCYAAFARDRAGNYADAATACGVLVAGDFDGDDDVDQQDFGRLQACFSGSGLAYSSGCDDADFDDDGDVDQDDLTAFTSCQAGAGQSPACK